MLRRDELKRELERVEIEIGELIEKAEEAKMERDELNERVREISAIIREKRRVLKENIEKAGNIRLSLIHI